MLARVYSSYSYTLAITYTYPSPLLEWSISYKIKQEQQMETTIQYNSGKVLARLLTIKNYQSI